MEALFLRPSPTYLTVGSYALAALALLGAFLAAVRFAYLPSIVRSVMRAAEALSVLVDIVVMLYTGLLLQDAAGVVFWHSPLVPVLFALPSLSCGAAVLPIAAFFAEPDERVNRMARSSAALPAIVVADHMPCARLRRAASRYTSSSVRIPMTITSITPSRSSSL
ncbi:NrfD/PsrC family molybdoenzyme membrane anchor subunit [Enteroscipio rubneri]|uniref:NrfD/PsrC family molybdoenzyme membrane anchor subunit n=1 Tax=Enteroscipio rubneri TaxID=2070686 RepID=UPI00320AF31E